MIKITSFFQIIAKNVPNLSLKLKQAEISDSPEDFIKKTIISSFFTSFALIAFLWMVLSKISDLGTPILLSFPVLFSIIMFYFLRVPDVKVMRKKKETDSEIIYAGRFLIIEIESGVPLYDAFKNISKNYPLIGKYFSEITNRVDLGTDMEAAINEGIKFTPSSNFRKILWQITNSLQTGADFATSLKSVVEQITKEQMIEIKEYGRKLNPLAMFYMIIAVILPSIGITMFIVLSTFLNLTLDLPILIAIAFFMGFIQFMFLAMIKSSRPSVEL